MTSTHFSDFRTPRVPLSTQFMYLKLIQIAFFANMFSAGMVSDNFVSVNLVLNMVSVNVVSTIMVSSHLLSAKAGKISPENPTFQA